MACFTGLHSVIICKNMTVKYFGKVVLIQDFGLY